MQTLSIKKTNKYVGTYDYLDEWQEIGTYEVLQRGTLEDTNPDEEDYCDAGTAAHVIKVTSAADDDDIRRALESSFSKHGCHHDYDCCGCISTSARAVKDAYGDGRWIVITNSSRNY